MDKNIKKYGSGVEKTRNKEILVYIFAIILCAAILVYVLQLWNADIRIPFVYAGDANYGSVLIKSMIDTGWYISNPYLGGADGTSFTDFPISESFHFLIMKIIALYTSEYGVVINVYYLLGYFLAAISALYVLRRFKIDYAPAVLCSLLFTFMPYHFFRNEVHLFLSAYYMIPLNIMVALWLFDGHITIIHKKGENIFKENLKNRYLIEALIICAITSSTGVYFAFFSCFFFGIAILTKFLSDKKISGTVIAGFLLIIVICTGLLLNILPSIIYNTKYGANELVGKRYWFESEIYALRMTGLILPVIGHRIKFFNWITTNYMQGTQLPNHNICAPLGIIGCIGLLILLIYLFTTSGKDADEEKNIILKNLSKLNIAAILLATAGGLGTIFAMLVSPQIRAYDRISIFISFFCLFAVAICLQKIIDRCKERKSLGGICILVAAGMLCFGVFDQTSPNYVYQYGQTAYEFKSDENFIKNIENILDDNALVFQLPYHSFPEAGPLYKLNDYDHFKGYLHSKSLRWSYGAMRGRQGDKWLENVAAKPLEEMLNIITVAGYSGIYIDRFGYEDNGAAIESKLKEILGVEPIVSDNSRLSFFDITGFAESLKGSIGDSEWNFLKEQVLKPLELSWMGEFSVLESSDDLNWRWCGSTGQLEIVNPSEQERKVLLSMVLKTGYVDYSNLSIKGDGFEENIKVNSDGYLFEKEVVIPPGELNIYFSCDAKRVESPSDPRTLVFAVMNFVLAELD